MLWLGGSEVLRKGWKRIQPTKLGNKGGGVVGNKTKCLTLLGSTASRLISRLARKPWGNIEVLEYILQYRVPQPHG